MNLTDYLAGLTVTQGRRAGEPLTVLPWQRKFVAGAFKPGRTTAALSVARGNGKTVLVAGIACAALDGPLMVPRARRSSWPALSHKPTSRLIMWSPSWATSSATGGNIDSGRPASSPGSWTRIPGRPCGRSAPIPSGRTGWRRRFCCSMSPRNGRTIPATGCWRRSERQSGNKWTRG